MPIQYTSKSAPQTTSGPSVVEFNLPAPIAFGGHLIGEVRVVQPDYVPNPVGPSPILHWTIAISEGAGTVVYDRSILGQAEALLSFSFGGMRCADGKPVKVHVENAEGVAIQVYLGLVVQ